MVKFVVKEREENEACFVIDEDEGLIFELKPPADLAAAKAFAADLRLTRCIVLDRRPHTDRDLEAETRYRTAIEQREAEIIAEKLADAAKAFSKSIV
jgi:hypothetical protein